MQLIQAHSWQELITREMAKNYWPKLAEFVKNQYQTHQCFPPKDQIFRAFELTPLDRVKVVILGQDPYHGHGQAHGLAFSVPQGVPIPPSLKNILKEVYQSKAVEFYDNQQSEQNKGQAQNNGFDLKGGPNVAKTTGDLTPWAQQGVLLLNTVLTVTSGQAGSHQKKGWEQFTDAVINEISEKGSGIVFMLWGGFAQKKMKLIDTSKHLVLTSGHPSPLSANRGLWFGCDHFNKANNYLRDRGKLPIDWKAFDKMSNE